MGELSVDFTAYWHPVLAVRCQDCGKKAGSMCSRPSGHRAHDFHASRKRASDALFVAQHGEDAWIERIPDGWKIHLDGFQQATEQPKGSSEGACSNRQLILGF